MRILTFRFIAVLNRICVSEATVVSLFRGYSVCCPVLAARKGSEVYQIDEAYGTVYKGGMPGDTDGIFLFCSKCICC